MKGKTWFYNLMGWELPAEKKKDEVLLEQPATEGAEASEGSGIRKRKGGVRVVETKEEWDLLREESSDLNPLVVDFTATWCKPCQGIAPFFEKLSHKYPGTFVKVDVDDLEEVAAEAEVKAMPTFQLYHGTKKVKQVTGAIEADLEAMVAATST
eukprot:CAMPEP_0184290878 /NCGR_PEP_ID=MMETSP1049-20130417/3019_1 /TAXON_ID=77928 /ORGANISM="Proteomonas sulcata, Strain CCMP704" /LENGTH=153 /DNA_ID=CAMNT_0026598147 /DNA_START=209 /DNA_END=670 /DNA_ORIENTATION=-